MIKFIKRLFRLDGDDLISQDQFEENLIKLVTKLGSSLSNIVPYMYGDYGIYNIANVLVLTYSNGYVRLFEIGHESYPWTVEEDSIVVKDVVNRNIRCTCSYQVDTFKQWRKFKSDLLRRFISREIKASYSQSKFIEGWNYIFWRLTRNPYISNIRVKYSSGSNKFTYTPKFEKPYQITIEVIRSGIMSSTYLVTIKKGYSTRYKQYLSKSGKKMTIDEFLHILDKGKILEDELQQNN